MPTRITDTKERILETATNLFSCHGFRATSIDDILTAVGITKGAFYHYFKGKDHLCQVILDQAIAEYHQLAQSLERTEDSMDPLERWCRLLIEKQLSGQWLYYHLLTRLTIEATALDTEIQHRLKLFWSWCQTFHETLLDNTDASTAEPRHLARLFMGAHFGTIWLDRCDPGSQDLATACETLLRLMQSE